MTGGARVWNDRGRGGYGRFRRNVKCYLVEFSYLNTLFSGLPDDNVLSPNVGRSKAPI